MLKIKDSVDPGDEMEFSNNNNNKPSETALTAASDNKLIRQAVVSAAMNTVKKKKKNTGLTEEDVSGINDRVFVCLGKLKENKQPHAWVMTLNKTYNEVTFWEVNTNKKYVLNGRIVEEEEKRL